jgi:hypothetical protein
LAKAPKKRKRKEPANVSYEVEVHDWEVHYHFGIAPKNLNDIIRGVYWETSNLTLLGKILSPALKNASSVKIDISSDPQMEDYWTTKPTILSAKAIGWMEIPRGETGLHCHCSVPPRLSSQIHVAVSSGKVKFVSIDGTALKWRRGTILQFSLATNRDEV